MKKIKNKSILKHVLEIYMNNNISYMLKLFLVQIEYLYISIFKNKSFEFNRENLRYFVHFYNRTWLNERCIELSIGRYFINKYNKRKILEIGNVMSHYQDVYHTVIDKYESSINVLNLDVADFSLNQKFELIISLSTMEHVGWDEEIKDPDKIIRSINNLKSHLSIDGVILITLPIGYNSSLDYYLREGKLKFDESFCYVKVNKYLWRPVDISKIFNCKYNFDNSTANSLLVGIIYK